MEKIDNFRYYTYDIILNIFLDIKKFKSINLKKIKIEDSCVYKNKIRHYVSDIIRYYYYLYEIINNNLNKKTKLKFEVFLLIGVYEILFTNQPDYAVVNEIVELVKTKYGLKMGNYINAVLKKIILKKSDIKIKYNIYEFIPLKLKQIINNNKLLNNEQRQQCYEFIYSKPVYYFFENNNKKLDFKIKSELFKSFENECLTLKDNIKFEKITKYLKNGNVYLQDVSSQFYINTVLKNIDFNADFKILDLTAAPGGKIINLLNSLGSEYKYEIWLNDIDFNRLRTLKKNIANYVSLENINFVCSDMLKVDKLFKIKYFDLIFYDAPCIGLGVINKFPESLLIDKFDNIKKIAKNQYRTLKKCFELLKNDGVLCYSVCSFSYAETLNVINKIKTNYNRKVEKVKYSKTILKNNIIEEDNTITILPEKDNNCGFFFALIK